jgi:hypothetical protein
MELLDLFTLDHFLFSFHQHTSHIFPLYVKSSNIVIEEK